LGEVLLDGGTSGQIHTAVLENLELRMGCCKFFLWEVEFRKINNNNNNNNKKEKKEKKNSPTSSVPFTSSRAVTPPFLRSSRVNSCPKKNLIPCPIVLCAAE